MKLPLIIMLSIAAPFTLLATEHETEAASDVPQETTTLPVDTQSAPPVDTQSAPPDMHHEHTADPSAPDEEAVTEPEETSIQEEIATLHHETEDDDDDEASNDRFVLFVDALKYRVTTHSTDATHARDKNETSISSSSTTTTLRALDATIGLKSYHDRLILGFGISSNLVSPSDARSGGVLMAGYQLLEGLEIGGLLYISNHEKTTSTRREDSIDEQFFTSNEESSSSSSVHSFGPWLKLRAGNYWQALFAIYYTSSHTEQTSDSGQQTGDSQDTLNNLTTTVKRSYFALDLVFGPWIPLTEHLTFVPQINLTWYLPRTYTQTTSMSSSGGSSLAEDTLEFDEHSSLDYSLTLGGLRYEL